MTQGTTQGIAPPPPVILIVEFEGTISGLMAARLIPLGHLVITAPTAQAASSTLATYPILLAIVNHIAGISQQDNSQLIRLLKQKGVPVIVISTVQSSLDDVAKDVEATFIKPFRADALLKEVRKHLP